MDQPMSCHAWIAIVFMHAYTNVLWFQGTLGHLETTLQSHISLLQSKIDQLNNPPSTSTDQKPDCDVKEDKEKIPLGIGEILVLDKCIVKASTHSYKMPHF